MLKSSDASLRKTRPEARTTCVQFAPTARSWTASTTEGLLMYSLDNQITFDPFELELDITPESLEESLMNHEYLKALVMSFKLGEEEYTRKVYHSVPKEDILMCCKDLPMKYLIKFFKFLGKETESSQRIQFHLIWIQSCLKFHGVYLKDHSNEMSSCLKGLQKNLNRMNGDLRKVCDNNRYSITFILDLISRNSSSTLKNSSNLELENQKEE